jgi:hypothetical protein
MVGAAKTPPLALYSLSRAGMALSPGMLIARPEWPATIEALCLGSSQGQCGERGVCLAVTVLQGAFFLSLVFK